MRKGKLISISILLLFLFSVYPVSSWTGYSIKTTTNQILSLSQVKLTDNEIKVDANGDGDIDDTGDYVLYNELYVLEGLADAKVKLVYSIETSKVVVQRRIEDLRGEIVEIRGENYLITDTKSDQVTLGRAVTKRPPKLESVKAELFSQIVGDVRVGLKGAPGTSGGELYISQDGDTTWVMDLTPVTKGTEITSYVSDVTDALDGYGIFLTDDDPIELSVVKSDELQTITDRQNNVFNYDMVKINDENFPKGEGRIKFLSELYTVEKEETVKLKDISYPEGKEPYKLQFNTLKEFRVYKGIFSKNETATAATPTVIREWTGLPISAVSNRMYTLADAKLTFGKMRVDANSDGDIGDEEDYVLYDELYVLDGAGPARVRLSYTITPPQYGLFLSSEDMEDLKGEVITVKGKEYLVTHAGGDRVKIGEALKKAVGAMTSFTDEIKMGIEKDPAKVSRGTLKIFGSDIEEGVDIEEGRVNLDEWRFGNKSDISGAVHEVSDAADDYTIFLMNEFASSPTIAMTKTSELIDISNGDKDVLGYALVKVNDEEMANGTARLRFLSKLYELEKGDEAEVEDNPAYTIKLNNQSEVRVFMGTFPVLKEEEPLEWLNQTHTKENATVPVETPPPNITAPEPTPPPETTPPPAEVPVEVNLEELLVEYPLLQNLPLVKVGSLEKLRAEMPLTIVGSDLDSVESTALNQLKAQVPDFEGIEEEMNIVYDDSITEYKGKSIWEYDLILIGGPTHNQITAQLAAQGNLDFKDRKTNKPKFVIESATGPAGRQVIVAGSIYGYVYNEKDLPIEGIIPESAAAAAAIVTSAAAASAAVVVTQQAATIVTGQAAAAATQQTPSLYMRLLERLSTFARGAGEEFAEELISERGEKVEVPVAEAAAVTGFFGFTSRELGAGVFTALIFGVAWAWAELQSAFVGALGIYIIASALALIVHEFAHNFVASRYELDSEFKVWKMGILLVAATSYLMGNVFATPSKNSVRAEEVEKRQKGYIFLAGPMVNIVFAAAFYPLMSLGGFVGQLATVSVPLNLMLAVYALMPFDPMDGAEIFRWKKLAWLLAFVPVFAFYFYMFMS